MEALIAGAAVFGIAALAIWLGFRAARQEGASAAERDRLRKDVDRATEANKARADVDRLSDADVDAGLRDDFRRDVPRVPPDPPRT